MSPPRTHELGGTYGKGTVVANYASGQILEATVEITAFHKGYWSFKICPEPTIETSQRCFDKYPLQLEDGGIFYYPPKGGTFTTRYRLPDGLSCDHCILQWRYIAGNNWGRCDNGTEAVGCGNQETFGACSDIAISPLRYTEPESIPLDLKSAQGLFRLLQKANVAPYYTKPKKKLNKRKSHRKPRNEVKAKKRKKMLWQFVALTTLTVEVLGHGRVLQPPGRATMWRMGFKTPANYDDSGLNCGGFDKQYTENEGNCGICGDAYDMSIPRPHELGGTYGKGIIVGKYESGQILEAIVDITAFHKGYWYFKLCPDPKNEPEQACFDKYPLELEDGGLFYYPPKGGTFTARYRLPDGLSCDHCILQWRYVAGNNWGVCSNGTQAIGCGNQETFGSCSDISIARLKYIDAESGPLVIEDAITQI
ncbi:unnamed protein product [Leptosia nina]|uniref:Chitin-binding type-4 domain-containing protein n=1 Tax=Leptosia nina TaxID=320188 RepID=A0AAV1K1X3_9NEOP